MKQIRLYSPDGRMSRTVDDGGRLWKALLGRGWSSVPPALKKALLEPEHLGRSVTAAKARADLARRTPADWGAEWGPVLCAALDEVELEKQRLEERLAAMSRVIVRALDVVRRLSERGLLWIKRTGYRTGERLEPSIERQAEAEAFFLDVTAAVNGFREGAAADFNAAFPRPPIAAEAAAAVPAPPKPSEILAGGSPEARAAASNFLAGLAAEMKLPEGHPAAEMIAVLRARLGGSNAPTSGGGGEEPS